jgi:hypothetical protein
MSANQVTLAFHQWYAGLPLYAGLPARGTLAGAFVVLERLQETCDLGLIDQIDVESIETYVGTNIAEQSESDSDQLAHGFLRLFDEYNCRVDIAEIDRAFLIEIPANLQRLRPAVPGA